MRRAVTLRERLEEARAELWLCRLSCDLTLARWAPTMAPAEPERPADPAAGTGDPWPVWRPIWLHDRCRPVLAPAIATR